MSQHLSRWGQATFASFGVRNFRLYFIGQAISQSGTFMQQMAQAWLVLKLTNSGAALGLITALQTVPVLLLAPVGGALADRFSKRKLMVATQTGFALLALILGALVLTDLVRLWMVGILALCFGLFNCVDNPTRQSFVMEMVGADHVRNAVSLNATMINLARIMGPAIAGVLISLIGMPPCFIFNGLSYGAVVIMLLAMRPDELYTAMRTGSKNGGILDGFRYAFVTPMVRNPLLMLAIIGTFTIEYQVSLPLLAEFAFGGNAGAYAALSSAQGVGAIIGGIVTASRASTSFGTVVFAAMLLGLAALLASSMPTLGLAVAGVVLLGLCSIYFQSTANTTVQLGSDPQMLGRVMALWSMAGPGSSAIGAPIIGLIGQQLGARAGLATGGLAALVAAGLGFLVMRREAGSRMPGPLR